MALPWHALKLLAPHMREASVLSLGYPDLTVSAEQIRDIFGYTPARFTTGNRWIKYPVPDSEELFQKLGSKLTVVDYIAERGCEIVANLNEPHDFGKFDLVIDPGTLEHCFNFGQAMMNAANAVKPGGRIFHISPMTMINHGFFNLCPTLFHDFYNQNGWTVESFAVVALADPVVTITDRFTVAQEHLIRVVAQRKTGAALHFPIQSKYLQKHEKKEAA
jgi:SAM-dependent methyltransferase